MKLIHTVLKGQWSVIKADLIGSWELKLLDPSVCLSGLSAGTVGLWTQLVMLTTHQTD